MVNKDVLLSIMQKKNCMVKSIDMMKSGGNNQIYKATPAQGMPFAIKHYSSVELKKNERLDREFAALSWMQNNELHCVPKAFFKDTQQQLGFYEWVDGNKVSRIDRDHINQVIKFLTHLKLKCTHESSASLPLAKDACLSADQVFCLLDKRFKRLSVVGTEHADVRAFINQDCKVLYQELKQRLLGVYDESQIDSKQLLSNEHQTLSPSDYGFHNALVDEDGKLTFTDFEYFGWDDPVKMISDFLWHPGQQLNSALKLQFERSMTSLFSGDASFSVRMNALFPLYGLIWVLIVLNNFIPDVWESKLAAAIVKEDDKQLILQQQFEKACGLFNQVREYVMTVETV